MKDHFAIGQPLLSKRCPVLFGDWSRTWKVNVLAVQVASLVQKPERPMEYSVEVQAVYAESSEGFQLDCSGFGRPTH